MSALRYVKPKTPQEKVHQLSSPNSCSHNPLVKGHARLRPGLTSKLMQAHRGYYRRNARTMVLPESSHAVSLEYSEFEVPPGQAGPCSRKPTCLCFSRNHKRNKHTTRSLSRSTCVAERRLSHYGFGLRSPLCFTTLHDNITPRISSGR